MLLESWTLSYWRHLSVDVYWDVIESLQMRWLEWSITIIKVLVLHLSTAHGLTKSLAVFNGLVSLCSLVSDFDASCYLWLDISVVIASLLSNFPLVLCLQLDHFDWFSNDCGFLEIFDVFFVDTWGVFQFFNCIHILHSCVLLKFCSFCWV